MRLVATLTGLLAALPLVMPSAAVADTGGKTLYVATNERHVYRAPAAHLSKRTALPTPKAAAGGYVESVAPSPDGRMLAQFRSWVGLEGGGRAFRIIVTDRDGRHARTVWSRQRVADREGSSYWSMSGLGWGPRSGSGYRLYFAPTVHHNDFSPGGGFSSSSRLMTSVVSLKRPPTGPTRVQGGEGMARFTVDPTTGNLATARVDSSGCLGETPGTTTSTIVLFNPRTGTRRDLVTMTSAPFPAGGCTGPPGELAWSPDGSEIAFTAGYCCTEKDYLAVSEIGVVAVDGSDGDGYRVAVPADGRHLFASPTWRDAHGLWFTREILDDGASDGGLHERPDVFSVRERSGGFGPMLRRTHTTKIAENAISFG